MIPVEQLLHGDDRDEPVLRLLHGGGMVFVANYDYFSPLVLFSL